MTKLYDVVVPQFARTLGSTAGFLKIVEQACGDGNVFEDEILRSRIHPEMHPFAYQVKSTVEHSWGSIKAARARFATPNLEQPPDSLRGLLLKVEAAQRELAALTADEVNGFEDQEIRFKWKETRLTFSAQDFFLSYALPNFYFHATTAYAILRMSGLAIGKLDFLGDLPARRH
jgi:hypothetical protein